MRLLYQLTLQSSTQQSLVATLTLLRTTSHRVLLTLDEEETPYPSAIGLAHDPNRQSDVIAKEKNLSVNVRTRRPNNHVLAQPATTMLQTTLIAWFLRGGILRIIQNTPMHQHVSPIESTGIPPLIVPDTSYAYVPAADIPWATPAPSLITMEQPLEKKEPENKKKKKNESKEIKLNPAWGKFGSKQALVESSTTLSHRKLSQISIRPLLTLETCRTLLFCNVFGAAPELTNDEQDIEEFLHDPATVPRLTAVTLSLGPAGSLSIINRHGVLVGDILTQIQQYMEREIERSFWDKLPHVQRHNAKESCRRRRAAGHVSSSRVVMGDLLEGNIIFSGMASPARGSGGVFETHWEEH
ncbi:SubName: Full=Uncharacterized protein {ECO:0000313/EMBL:CCA67056.1} [Serendipita indica DSM 11827]|nr:SubName: Full=Uncharacterized protein {ECO:0000313/EMBL:CCA67056.1} [Serendipita indica DSM 11827]